MPVEEHMGWSFVGGSEKVNEDSCRGTYADHKADDGGDLDGIEGRAWVAIYG